MKSMFVTGLVCSLFAFGCVASGTEPEVGDPAHEDTMTDQARPEGAVDIKENDTSRPSLAAQCGGTCFQGGEGCSVHECYVDYWGFGYRIHSGVTSDCRATIVDHCHSHGSAFHDAYWY